MLDKNDRKLISTAIEQKLNYSYTPYSDFKVGSSSGWQRTGIFIRAATLKMQAIPHKLCRTDSLLFKSSQ